MPGRGLSGPGAYEDEKMMLNPSFFLVQRLLARSEVGLVSFIPCAAHNCTGNRNITAVFHKPRLSVFMDLSG